MVEGIRSKVVNTDCNMEVYAGDDRMERWLTSKKKIKKTIPAITNNAKKKILITKKNRERR